MSPVTGIEQKLAAGLSGIRANFVALLDERVLGLEDVARLSVGEVLSLQDATQIKFTSHKTLGTAATLGFAELGDAAGRLQDAILAAPDHVYSASLKAALEGFLEAADTAAASE